MAGRLLVMDEWLLHDLGGDNGVRAQQQSLEVLKRLKESPDRIVVRRPSPWMKKAYLLKKSRRTEIILISKRLHSLIQDQDCCRILDHETTVPIPEMVQQNLPRKDLYLVETYLAAEAELLVTHDEPFLRALQAHFPRVKCESKEVFLSTFLE